MQAGVIVVPRESYRLVHMNTLAAHMFGPPKLRDMIDQICHGRVCPAAEGACPVSDLAMTVDNAECEMVHATGRRIP